MRFTIITDTSANLPSAYLSQHQIAVVPLEYIIDGQPHVCLDTESFDGEKYYDDIRAGLSVATSQVAPQRYIDCFEPALARGESILFIGMSSGISGSFASAQIAADELRDAHPDAHIRLIDTLGASLGEGIFVLRAVECRERGMTLDETADYLLDMVQRVYQCVMVEDLMHLRRGGRVSGSTALLGTVLGIRPVLKGNEEGKFAACAKPRGRKAGIAALAKKYAELVDHAQEQTVGIAHAGCHADALALAEQLRAIAAPKEILIVCYEPVTGSHIGPGALALFFEGKDGVRGM